MRKPNISAFVHNLYSLFVYDYHKTDRLLERQMRQQIEQLENRIRMLNIKLEIDRYTGELSDTEEMLFLKNKRELRTLEWPYPQVKHLEQIVSGFDEKLKLPYIIHEGKHLYYPQDFTLRQAEGNYRILIEEDQILAGGYLTKAPHCYQTQDFKVEAGDVLIDCGAAEGLFALAMIDQLKHAYLIETEERWIPALQATFAPYKEKVTILNKHLSNANGKHQIALSNILDKHPEMCFIKMDIEGAETMVIQACLPTLAKRDNIRLAVCTYHKYHDAETLAAAFDQIGYWHEFSDGYFFFCCLDTPQPPYLRHAVIRAQKQH